ncbi:Mycothiol S-conjugate amidase [Trichinella pseudospiralis]
MTHTRLAHSGQETPKLTLTLYLNEGVHEDRSCSISVYRWILYVGVVWVGTTRSLIEGEPDDRLFELTELRFAVLAFGFW